jgi:hypothetical protein
MVLGQFSDICEHIRKLAKDHKGYGSAAILCQLEPNYMNGVWKVLYKITHFMLRLKELKEWKIFLNF